MGNLEQILEYPSVKAGSAGHSGSAGPGSSAAGRGAPGASAPEHREREGPLGQHTECHFSSIFEIVPVNRTLFA